MTDNEINSAVARKLGRNVPSLNNLFNTEDSVVLKVPDYCHDIKAAWEIVSFIYDSGIEIQVQGDNKQKWFCVIYKNEEGFPEAIAKSAPMAICLAFLKLP